MLIFSRVRPALPPTKWKILQECTLYPFLRERVLKSFGESTVLLYTTTGRAKILGGVTDDPGVGGAGAGGRGGAGAGDGALATALAA